MIAFFCLFLVEDEREGERGKHKLLLEDSADLLLGLSTGGLGEGLGGDDVLEVNLELVTGGHDVAVVDGLDERLDPHAVGNLLGVSGDSTGNLAGGLGDTDDDSVGELTGLRSLIVGLHDDSLGSGMATVEDDDDLSGRQAIGHAERNTGQQHQGRKEETPSAPTHRKKKRGKRRRKRREGRTRRWEKGGGVGGKA